jgi:hypothetical protein
MCGCILRLPQFNLKDIAAEVAILAIIASGANLRWFRKGFSLDCVMHGGQGGTSFGQKLPGHGETESDVVGKDKDETRRNRLGKMFGNEKRVSGQLEHMIAVGTAGRVFEV